MAELENDVPGEAVVDVRPEAVGVVITVSGHVDASNAHSLRTAVASAAKGHPHRIVFDMSRLQFIDSTGLAVLLNIASTVDVVLRNPSPAVRRVVELSGLTTILSFEAG